jgi:hypothetical protein
MHCFERCVPAPFFLSLFFARFRCLFRFRFFLRFFSGGERGRARSLRGLLSAFVDCCQLCAELASASYEIRFFLFLFPREERDTLRRAASARAIFYFVLVLVLYRCSLALSRFTSLILPSQRIIHHLLRRTERVRPGARGGGAEGGKSKFLSSTHLYLFFFLRCGGAGGRREGRMGRVFFRASVETCRPVVPHRQDGG